MRESAKLANMSMTTGQREAFLFSEMAPDETEQYLLEQLTATQSALIDSTPFAPKSIRYGDLWPKILARYAVRKPELNRMAAEARRDGRIKFLDWGARKRVPDDEYRMQRMS